MTIAEKVRANQDTQAMTFRAIKMLQRLGEDTADLEQEFELTYGMTIDQYQK